MNNPMVRPEKVMAAVLVMSAFASLAQAQSQPGEAPALDGDRITQEDITSGGLSLSEIRREGLKIFATPFNRLDGYGDGPVNVNDTTSPGGRPTLQNNGTFLRVNGLDAQTCQECHSIGSNATVPFRFAVGGVGGSNNNAIFQPTELDVDDSEWRGYAFTNGRYINPPFLFGSGGVELAAKEMTARLKKHKKRARNHPGVPQALTTHGVDFGWITYDKRSGRFDTSQVEGIDEDLVVRPFGRKGEFATVRGFDVDALAFHMGMEAVEKVGVGIDADRDGVLNEILIGELSAMHIFNTNLERPVSDEPTADSEAGFALFKTVGCSDCHRPTLETRGRKLNYSFPEDPAKPGKNVYYSVNLSKTTAGFEKNRRGGISVPLFSDLKRHDMGDDLAESFVGGEIDRQFITARLWGVADTAPYLHDGRALTLTDAILMHGGEALHARDNFDILSDAEKVQILTFLRTLRTPVSPNADIL